MNIHSEYNYRISFSNMSIMVWDVLTYCMDDEIFTELRYINNCTLGQNENLTTFQG